MKLTKSEIEDIELVATAFEQGKLGVAQFYNQTFARTIWRRRVTTEEVDLVISNMKSRLKATNETEQRKEN